MADAAEQFARFKALLVTPDLPALGPHGRMGTRDERDLVQQLDAFFARENLPRTTQSLLRSAALLWHDHLDASHTFSQGIETRDGSWLHGIMHRREPDYGNAKYWFHRVGKHPAFSKLALVAASRQSAADQNTNGGALTRRRYSGEWDPFTFIDDCEAAERGNDAAAVAQLREIQAAEFEVLVEHLFQNA